MFVFDVPGGETSGIDTAVVVSHLEESLVDTLAVVSHLETSLIDTAAVVSHLEESLVDSLAVVSHLESSLIDTAALISAPESSLIDTAALISAAEISLIGTRLLINPTAFLHASGNVYFPWPPQRPASRKVDIFQLRDRDSAAEAYVYAKGEGRVALPLVFPRVDSATLEALRAFVRSVVKGIRHPFTWRDHERVERTVRLESPVLRHRQVGPGRHRVEIDLEEDR